MPASPELRRALDASRRSLAADDPGDAQVKLDLDRYHGLQERLCRPDLRAKAEDSLFALWEADLEHPLWPDLAAFNWDLFQNASRFDAIFSRADFPDSSTAVGTYLLEWRKLRSGEGEPDFRRAWARREELPAFTRTWLALRLSRQQRQQGRADEAARLALGALPDARDLGGWSLELEAWLAATRALRVGDHLDDALHAARISEELAAAVARRTGNLYLAPFARLEHAEVLAARYEVEPALRLYASCVDSALAHGLTTLAGTCLNWAGIFTGGSGRLEEGLGFYRRGLALALAEQDSLNVPRHLSNIARRMRLLGDLDSCLVYLREAERWIAAYPDPGNRAFFPLIQAEVHAQLGDFRTVDSLLAAASSLQPGFSSIEALAELHLQLIKQGMERGRPGQAYRSIMLLDSLQDRLGTASVDRNELFDLHLASAEFLTRQGLFARAAQALERATAMLERRPDPARQWELWRARGNLARRREDPIAAEAAYRACLASSSERRDASHLAESRLLLGHVLLDQGRFADVRQLCPAEEEETFGGRFRTRLSTALLIAAADARDGRPAEALRTLDQARAITSPDSPPDLLARLDLQSGRAHAALGSAERAHPFYLRAKEQLVREQRHASSDLPVFFDSNLRRELAEALLELVTSTGDPRGEGAEAALEEIRALLPAWQSTGTVETDRLADPQVLYFVGTRVSFRWTVADGAISLRRLPGEADLLAALAPVVAGLSQPSRPVVADELAALAAALGGTPADWPADRPLTIVPDGPLFAVPWAALPLDGVPRASWIDRGPIALMDAPAVGHEPLPATRRRPPRLLALGSDDGHPGRAAGLAVLRHAEREAREVHALWPAEHASVRVGAAADWRALDARELAGYDVLHIASHALIYQGLADRTTLVLAGSRADPLTSAEIGQLDLDADLVFLSCCEAAERVRRGVGAAHAGLARSFLAAGARAVVAPSARIEDQAARHLTRTFYEHWLGGQDVAAALREAQRDLRDGDPRWAHPYYWAFYQAIGPGATRSAAAEPASPASRRSGRPGRSRDSGGSAAGR